MFWGFALAGVLVVPMVVDKVFIDRMFTIEDVTSKSEDADTSAQSRLVIAEAQLRMFLDYPMGTGWRGTAVLSPRYMDRKWLTKSGGAEVAERSSHNTYLTALVEQGLPGAMIYLCIVLWNIGAAFRIRHLGRADVDGELVTLGAGLCAALAGVLTAGITADYLTKEVQFWLYAGLTSVFWLARAQTQSGRAPAISGASPSLLGSPVESR